MKCFKCGVKITDKNLQRKYFNEIKNSYKYECQNCAYDRIIKNKKHN